MNIKTLGANHILNMLKGVPEVVTKRERIIPFLESRRYIPYEVSKEHFGYFRIDTVPHLREILESLEPEHPATHIAIIKSVQSGITTSVAENAMAYYICNELGSVLSLTINKDVAKIRGSIFDVLIDNTEGMAELLEPMSQRGVKRSPSGKQKADRRDYKEFIGGIQLRLGSYGVIGDMKSIPFVLIVRDEWAEAPQELKGQGSLDSMIEGRTMAASRFKILSLSTPSQSGRCQMEKSYLQGDQRRWFIPCPHCGTMQDLVMKSDQQHHGLTFETEKDKSSGMRIIPETVVYNCISCDKHFYDEHKKIFMPQGEWRPCWTEQNPPITENHLSYHLTGLISPFLSWERVCINYLKTNRGTNIIEYKNFSINFLGQAWEYVEERPDWKMFKEKADNYCMGEIPDAGKSGGLILFGGADVHQNRIELCICAFGEGLECWLIEREVFWFEKGKEHALHDSAWQKLVSYVYEYDHPIVGQICGVSVDSGYTPYQSKSSGFDVKNEQRDGLIEQFCLTYFEKFSAIRGYYDPNSSIIYRHRRSKKDANVVQTDKIKHVIFNDIMKRRGYGAIHFPKYRIVKGVRMELENFIYQSFCSEQYCEDEKGEMMWKKIFSRNEVLDCVVYSFASAYSEALEARTKEEWESYRKELEWRSTRTN